MKIDLANIAGTPGARGSYPISEIVPATEDVTTVGPVVGEIQVENTGSLLLVRGKLRATVRLTCVRCLGSFERPLAVDIEEVFATGETEPDVSTMDRDEPETSAMADYVLDVTEFVRQQIAVNMPMAFVCREDCKGICPKCGRDLNEGPCGCEAEPEDSRWSGLADLLRQPGEETQEN